MNDNIYAASNTIHEHAEEQFFYVVSKTKFFLLFILTLGIYSAVWSYLHWRTYMRASNEKMYPIARGFFLIFFIHSLCNYISEKLEKMALDYPGNLKSNATLLVCFLIASRIIEHLAGKGINEVFAFVVSIIAIFGTGYHAWKIQAAANIAEQDPEGNRNREFSAWNYFWMIIGSILWIFAILGMILGKAA